MITPKPIPAVMMKGHDADDHKCRQRLRYLVPVYLCDTFGHEKPDDDQHRCNDRVEYRLANHIGSTDHLRQGAEKKSAQE